MDHPAIVSIYDFGRHQGSLFFVMPVVQGTNLRGFLRQSSLPLGDVLDIGVQTAEALEYSHARGVVHRDIKPENIMVFREDGGPIRLRVMDFGLARAATESRLTKSGTLVGTLAYLSPEQVVASKEVDGRSDIYSLGTVLYECLVGEPPFSGEMQSILYRIVHEIPQPPRSLGAEIDEELERIVLASIAKDPKERPQTAGQLAESLRRYRATLRESDRSRSVAGLTRTFQPGRPAASPFVGRAKELAELQHRLNAALAGECQLVLVGGEPGIGKTRLVDELESLARARKIRVLHGRSVEQDRAFPYQGFCELIQEYFRFKEEDSAPPPDLSDVASDLVSLFPMLNEISDIRSAATGDSKLTRSGGASGPEDRTQVFELLARALTRIAGARPLILVLEDLHEAEVSIEALQYVARRLGPTPTLFIGTYRSTAVDRRHPLSRMLESFRGDRRFSSMTLSPFTASEHRLFLETLVGGPKLSDSLVTRLFEGTEGNPFFTKELVRSLLDSGAIARDPTGAWSLSGEGGVSLDALPATIQQAVEERIGRLPEELRDILSVAAVIGRSFDYKDLEKLVEGKVGLEDAVDRLVQEGYFEEERESRGDVLSFGSGVVRDVLYASLSRRKRRSLHQKCAELIESRHSGRIERVLPQLLHHFYQADVPEKTVEYGLRLSKTSIEAFSAEEAARSARTALEFLDEEWEGERLLEGEARILLAKAHRMSGDIDAALKECASAHRVFEQQGDSGRAISALALAADTAWQARRSEEAGRWVEKGLAATRGSDETESLRQFLLLAATLANLRSEYDKANELMEEAARLGATAREAEKEREIPRGGSLVVALANPVKRIEPATIETNEEFEVAANVFETLIATDARGNLLPQLCEKWEVLNGGKTFLLAIRRGVRFSDGEPLTARHVKASIETSIRRAAPQIPSAWAAIEGTLSYREGKASEVAGVAARDDFVLEVRLEDALPIYPALLSEERSGVVRATEGGLFGTGPFVVASHKGDRVVLKRNPEYWREGIPKLDGIEFRIYGSVSTIAKEFRTGEIDLARDLLLEDLEETLRDPRFRRGIVEVPKRNTYFILFNARSGPVAKEASVRRALSGSVRARDLVWRTLGRFAQPASCWIPPGTLGHDPGKRSPILTREEAVEILASSGFAPPIRLNASVHPLLRDRYGALLTALFSLWADLGVEVSIATPDMASYLDSWPNNTGLDLTIGRWNADYDDPDNFTFTLFHSASGALRGYFCSNESDEILEEARSEGRPSVRENLYRKFEALLSESGTMLPLFHDIDYRLAGTKVRGLELRGTAPYVNYGQIGVAESQEPRTEIPREAGGVVQVPVAGVVQSMDPACADTVEAGEVVSSVYETLTRDAGGARFVPWLATDIRVEASGLKYRFRLRDDVRFHDGRKLSARDVRYSFERLLQSEGEQPRWLYSCIKGAKAVLSGEAGDLAGLKIHSATELTMELEEPVAFFLALIGYPGAGIVPEGADPSGEAAVGTGPFRVVQFEPGRRLELQRNKAYWRKGYPRSEDLVFTFAVSPKEILSGFRAGRFSLASDLLPEDAESLRHEPDFASGYRETPRLITYFALLNAHRGPLRDPRLRRVLAGAIDAPKLVRQTVGRIAVAASGLIPPGLLGHESVRVNATQSSAASKIPPEKLASPVELTVALHPLFFEQYASTYREIARLWSELGFKIRVVNGNMAEYLDAMTHGTTDAIIGRWGADYPDADTFVYILHSKGGGYGRYTLSPELDRLAEGGRAEASPAVRHALYREAEEILARDALLIPLFHEQAYRFARPEVEGLTVSFATPTVAYENLRVRG
jgi:ABC-type transport system substrate-binding protein